MKTIFIKNIIKLIIGGLVVGLLHRYDLIVAILIFIKLLHSFYKNYKKDQLTSIMVIGFIITGFVGLLFEYLGTWTYYIPYQIFGVPLAAIAALTITHYTLHVVLSYTSKRFGIKDLFFNPIKT